MRNIFLSFCICITAIAYGSQNNFMTVTLRSPRSNNTSLLVPVNATAAEIMDTYKVAKNLPDNTELVLFFADRGEVKPEDQFTPDEVSKDVFSVVIKTKSAPIKAPVTTKKITIKNLYSGSHTINYEPNDTIEDIIKKYRKTTGLGEKYEITLFVGKLETDAYADKVLKPNSVVYAADSIRGT